MTQGAAEITKASLLRLGSNHFGKHSTGLLRITSGIPDFKKKAREISPVIPNVLDTGFEETLKESQSLHSAHPGSFVSIGSIYAYRNIGRLLDAYDMYRLGGGSRGLLIAGPIGNRGLYYQLQQRVAGMDGVLLKGAEMSRAECHATMRESFGVLLPSLVEASPFSVLEAVSATPRVVMSDIMGNREVLAPYGSDETAFFSPTSVVELATAMRRIESEPCKGQHSALTSYESRQAAREIWAKRLDRWLKSLSSQMRTK